MKEEILKVLSKRKLKSFVSYFWDSVDPHDYITNWHIDAICDHLEAVISGDITRLIINVPPRSLKSTIVSIMFPCWAWLIKPELQFLFSSYAQQLSIRDSTKSRRLIQTPKYMNLIKSIYPLFELAGDQNAKQRYENNMNGHRIATSVGGALTGEGGDIIVCFPYNEILHTEDGPIEIGKFVHDKTDRRVWSWNQSTGKYELKRVLKWNKNPGQEMIKITFSDGNDLTCTRDHKIWTNRGWVEAENLCPSDMLPASPILDISNSGSINSEFLPKNPKRLRRIEDLKDFLVNQFSPIVHNPFSSPFTVNNLNIFCNAFPSLSRFNPLDSSSANIISDRKLLLGEIPANCNLKDLFFSQLGETMRFPLRQSPMPASIIDILLASPIGKIIKRIIQGITIKMPDIIPNRPFPYKSQKHQRMDGPIKSLPVFSQGNPCISSIQRSLEGDIVNSASNLTAFSDRISIESQYRNPLKIVSVGHVDTSYCLTVEDNHSMIMGRCLVITHNCDDPHNTIDAESDTKRTETTFWWDEAMSTRLNNPKTGAYIIIMQRLHETDLTGHILEKEGEYWNHLCIPARFDPKHPFPIKSSLGFKDPRTKDGELLSPKRFTEEVQTQLEVSLGEFAVAGQLQQMPSPRKGGMFEVENFKIVPMPKADQIKRIIRYWDKAGTEGGGKFSAGVKMAEMKEGHKVGFVIMDIRHGQWKASRREENMRQCAEEDGVGCVIWTEQEPGSGGKESAEGTIRNLAGYIVKLDRVTGSKEDRAEPFSVQVNAGNIGIALDPEPRKVFIEEHRKFPVGKFKDLVDSAAGGFNKMAVKRRRAGVW